MKHVKLPALILILILLFGTSAFASVSDYHTLVWDQIDYYVDEELRSISITINGVVGVPTEDGEVKFAEIPYTYVNLYYDSLYDNEDGTYTVYTEDEVLVLTKDELIEKYAYDGVKLIPVVEGATMTIRNVADPEQYLDWYPTSYDFLDKEKTILTLGIGQVASYDTVNPFTFNLWHETEDGINDFAYTFPVGLIIDDEVVYYGILPVTEEKAAELMAALKNEAVAENENVPEAEEEDEAVVEESDEKADNSEGTIVANPTTTKFEVNGEPVAMEAYVINNNNYVKLRDFAMAVNGTTKQFNVTWNQDEKAIYMYSETPYETVGGELAAGDGTSKAAELSIAKVYKDNEEVTLTAYTIGGYNYFKLRDIAKVFDIGVIWDGETLTAKLDTGISYEE